MLATKIGKMLYRGRKIDGGPFRDAELWVVSSIIGGDFAGQAIGECIFVLPEYAESDVVLRHEYIHVKQWRRLGSFGFAIRYGWEFVKNYLELLTSGYQGDRAREAYLRISLEKEAGKT